MEASAKVTSKGQVTIPVEVRRALGIEEGDQIVFEVAGRYATVHKRRSVVEIAAEWRAKHPLGEPRYASEREAIAAYHRRKVTEDAARRGRLAIAGPHGVRYLASEGLECPDEGSDEDG